MARKILNRKELRAENEAAEQLAEGKEKPVKAKAAPKKKTKKAAKVVRMKAFWGVYNQSMKRVALYEFADKQDAQKKAEDLSASQKSPHFIQPVREAIQE